jgi:hypothetical protein
MGRRIREAAPRKLMMRNGNCPERLPNTKLLKFNPEQVTRITKSQSSR